LIYKVSFSKCFYKQNDNISFFFLAKRRTFAADYFKV